MEDNNLVKLEDESGKEYNMIILKEFDFESKKYAVLMEMNECHCTDDCDCEDGCDEECSCGCGDECHCTDDCDCGCHDEPMVCLLEIVKENGKEIFKSIEDEKEFDRVVKEADKVLYE